MSSPNATPANSAPDPAPSCPRCGRAIPAAAPLGTCPHCLFAAGLPSILGAPSPDNTAPPSPAELSPEFPSLDILELLGRGGMGAVYKARQRDLGRLVALKILRPGLDASPGFAERFTREARALARLNHPGIVTLYEFGRTPAGRYFILMEFVDGVNLRGLLAAGRLSPREALAIVPPLCDALQYAHDGGLVHRDIKPENILVDRLGRVKIADFGIARLAAADGATTTETEVAGTPAYMAPEQKDRPDAVDHRADLYALGVVLYQMLTGELPAPGQLRPPSSRVRIDVRLDEIVLRALAKDPDLRYAAASEFKTQVETVAHTLPPSPLVAASAGPQSTIHATSLTGISYRSRRHLCGLPLIDIATGIDPATGRRRVARGIIAIGDRAQGVVAIGGLAMGVFTFGGASIGVFGCGGLAIGLFVYGGLGLAALLAFAGFAIAPVAIGGAALGYYAAGGSAWGAYVSSPARQDPAALGFFEPWIGKLIPLSAPAGMLLFFGSFALMSLAYAWAHKQNARASTTDSAPTAPRTPPPPAPSSSPAASSSGFRFHPWALVAGLTLFHLFLLHSSADQLPARVASHFNAAGQADGWMPRASFFLFAGVFPCALAALFLVTAWLIKRLPARFINLPHRDHWLAPEHREETFRALRDWMAAPACLVLIFFAQLHQATVLANQLPKPRLPEGMVLGATLGFLLALMVSLIGLLLRFAEPAATAAKRSRQTRVLVIVGLLAMGAPSILFSHAWRSHAASSDLPDSTPSVPAGHSRQILPSP